MAPPYPVVSWRDFVDSVQLAAPGCAIPFIVTAVREAAIRFCKETRIWHFNSLPSDLVAGQAYYAFAAPEGAEVISVKHVEVKGQPIAPCTEPDWPYGRDEQGMPRLWRLEEPGVLHFWPTPAEDIDASVLAKVVGSPSPRATECPALLLNHHKEAIVEGAKETLLLIPGQEWSNPQLAAVARARFDEAVLKARVQEQQGGTSKSMRAKPRRFI